MPDRNELIRRARHDQDEAARRGPRLSGRTWAWIFREQDRLADLAISGGFDTRRGNVCPACHLARAKNGTCCG